MKNEISLSYSQNLLLNPVLWRCDSFHKSILLFYHAYFNTFFGPLPTSLTLLISFVLVTKILRVAPSCVHNPNTTTLVVQIMEFILM